MSAAGHCAQVAIAAALVAPTLAAAQSRLHPDVALRDAEGRSVLESGGPVSPVRSCAGCHDTAFIASHSYHVSAGSRAEPPFARPWDRGTGLWGRWQPLINRTLTPDAAAPRPDLSPAEWAALLGPRHVGGGPAAAAGEEAWRLDASTRQPVPWDAARGGTEMDCFLCHAARPDPAARAEALRAGAFAWAPTASLARTGLVDRGANGEWRWRREAFREGRAPQQALGIGDPRATHCGACHGVVHTGSEPLELRPGLHAWATETKGQVFSAQRIADSALNVAGKEQLTRPWDVHAERLLECASCHPSLNNPGTFTEAAQTRPEHLRTQARRLEIDEFLRRPSHDFAKGDTAQGTVARRLAGSMRGCADCHRAEATHARWLPFTDRHLARLDCAVCHLPAVHAPARQETDWTLLTPSRQPRVAYRGVEGEPGDPAALITGFRPVLLPRLGAGGEAERLVPANLVTTWFWVSGRPPQPVRQVDLAAALFAGEGYHPDVIAALDDDGDGRVAPGELRLDTAAKVAAVRARLEAVGVLTPHIAGEVQPYQLHHGVAPARDAVRACSACHGSDSRLGGSFELARRAPAGAELALAPDARVALPGPMVRAPDGRLVLQVQETGAYVLGHDRAGWVDALGALAVLGALLAAGAHGGLRWLRRRGGTA